jgi:hypothetical protein
LQVLEDGLGPYSQELELLRVFAQMDDFPRLTVRPAEEAEVQRLVERVPVPVLGASSLSAAKPNVLLQAWLSRLPLDGWSLAADTA